MRTRLLLSLLALAALSEVAAVTGKQPDHPGRDGLPHRPGIRCGTLERVPPR